MEKTIQELNQITGVTDDWWVLMGDPDNTGTYKIKMSDFFQARNLTVGTLSTMYIKSPKSTTVIGTNDFTTEVGSRQNNFILGGYNTSVRSNYFGVVGGYNTGDSFRAGSIFSNGVNAGEDAHLIATNASVCTTINCPGGNNILLGGSAHYLNVVGSANGSGIIVGYNNKVISDGIVNIIFGGASNWLGDSTYAGTTRITGTQNAILMGSGNGITSATDGAASGNQIINSTNSKLDSTTRCGIIGGSTVVLTSLSDTYFVGVQSYTGDDTDTYDETTYVDNFQVLGQEAETYYDNGSASSFTLNWDNGNKQKVSMSANSTFTFTNVRPGATYTLAVDNEGSFSITSVTVPAGYTLLCEGGSIPNITNNGQDLCVLEVMGTNIYVRHFADFSTP